MEEEEWTGSDATVYVGGSGIAAKRFFRERCFEVELAALRRLRHPNVVRLLGWDDFDRTLWTSLYDRDVLRALLAGVEVDAVALGRDLLAALAHCCGAGLVHGDVKPENVLLGRGGAALCDFARCVELPQGAAGVERPFGGTRVYGAPEALRGWCSPAADAWGAGCVLYVVVERLMPFEEDDDDRSPPTLKSELWPTVKSAAAAARLFEPEWQRRLPASEALDSWS